MRQNPIASTPSGATLAAEQATATPTGSAPVPAPPGASSSRLLPEGLRPRTSTTGAHGPTADAQPPSEVAHVPGYSRQSRTHVLGLPGFDRTRDIPHRKLGVSEPGTSPSLSPRKQVDALVDYLGKASDPGATTESQNVMARPGRVAAWSSALTAAAGSVGMRTAPFDRLAHVDPSGRPAKFASAASELADLRKAATVVGLRKTAADTLAAEATSKRADAGHAQLRYVLQALTQHRDTARQTSALARQHAHAMSSLLALLEMPRAERDAALAQLRQPGDPASGTLRDDGPAGRIATSLDALPQDDRAPYHDFLTELGAAAETALDTFREDLLLQQTAALEHHHHADETASAAQKGMDTAQKAIDELQGHMATLPDAAADTQDRLQWVAAEAMAIAPPGFPPGTDTAIGTELLQSVKRAESDRQSHGNVAGDALPALALMEITSRAVALVTQGHAEDAATVLRELGEKPTFDHIPLPGTGGPAAAPVVSDQLRSLFRLMTDVPRGIETLHAMGRNGGAPIGRHELQALNAYWRADKAQSEDGTPAAVQAWLQKAKDVAAHEVRGLALPDGTSGVDRAAFNAVRNGYMSNAPGSAYDRHNTRMKTQVDAWIRSTLGSPGLFTPNAVRPATVAAQAYGVPHAQTAADTGIRDCAKALAEHVRGLAGSGAAAASTPLAAQAAAVSALNDILQAYAGPLSRLRLGKKEVEVLRARVSADVPAAANTASPSGTATGWVSGRLFGSTPASPPLPPDIENWARTPQEPAMALAQLLAWVQPAEPDGPDSVASRVRLPPVSVPGPQRPNDLEMGDMSPDRSLRDSASALEIHAQRQLAPPAREAGSAADTETAGPARTAEARLFFASVQALASYVGKNPNPTGLVLDKRDFRQIRADVAKLLDAGQAAGQANGTQRPVQPLAGFLESLSNGSTPSLEALRQAVAACDDPQRKVAHGRLAEQIGLPRATAASAAAQSDSAKSKTDVLDVFLPVIENIRLRDKLKFSAATVKGAEIPGLPWIPNSVVGPVFAAGVAKRDEVSMQAFFPIIGLEVTLATSRQYSGKVQFGAQIGAGVSPDKTLSGSGTVAASLGKAETRQEGMVLRFFREPGGDANTRKQMASALESMMRWDEMTDPVTGQGFDGPMEAVLANSPVVSVLELSGTQTEHTLAVDAQVGLGWRPATETIAPALGAGVGMSERLTHAANTRQESFGQTRINAHKESSFGHNTAPRAFFRYGFGAPTRRSAADGAAADAPANAIVPRASSSTAGGSAAASVSGSTPKGKVALVLPGTFSTARDISVDVERHGVSAYHIANGKQDADHDRHYYTPSDLQAEIDRNREQWLARGLEKLPAGPDGNKDTFDNREKVNRQLVDFEKELNKLGNESRSCLYNVNYSLRSPAAAWIDSCNSVSVLARMAGDEKAEADAAASRDAVFGEDASWRPLMLIVRDRGRDQANNGVDYFVRYQNQVTVETQRTAAQFPPEPVL